MSRWALILCAVAAACLAACGGAAVPRAEVAGRAPAARGAPADAGEPAAYMVVRERSRIEVFGADKITGEHRVVFESFSGALDLAHPSRSRLDVDMRSLVADGELVAKFIRSPSFLDVERYPKATFEVTGLEEGRTAERYALEGLLELHGVRRAVAFPATIRKEGEWLTVEADFLLSRHAFDIRRSDWIDGLIDADVRVHFELRARSARRASE